MTGKKHSSESLARMSRAKKEQYINGEVKVNLGKISSYEKKIRYYLDEIGIKYYPQYHIKGHPYLYDIFLEEFNTIIEFQGDYWHANPRRYPPGTMLAIQSVGKILVEDIWEKDLLKKLAAENSGISVIYIWEMDFKKDGLSTIDKILVDLRNKE